MFKKAIEACGMGVGVVPGDSGGREAIAAWSRTSTDEGAIFVLGNDNTPLSKRSSGSAAGRDGDGRCGGDEGRLWKRNGKCLAKTDGGKNIAS